MSRDELLARLQRHGDSIRAASSIQLVAWEVGEARALVPVDKQAHSSDHDDDDTILRRALLRTTVQALKRTTQLRLRDRGATSSGGLAEDNAPTKKMTLLYGELFTEILTLLGNLCLGPVPVGTVEDLTGILVSFSILVSQQPDLAKSLRPLATCVWQQLVTMKVTHRLNPNRWFDVLRAASVLGIQEDWQEVDDNSLTTRLYQRLIQGDALGRLSTDRLMVALSMDTISSVGTSQNRAQQDFLVGVSRRLRKQKVRNELTDRDLLKSVARTSRWLQKRRTPGHQVGTQVHGVDPGSDTIEKEAGSNSASVCQREEEEMQSLAYTLCQDFTYRMNRVDASPPDVSDVALIFQCVSNFVPADQVIVQDLCKMLSMRIDENPSLVSLTDVIKILQALERWRSPCDPILCRQLGMIFLREVREGPMSPWQANSILRCAVLLCGKQRELIRPYCEGAILLLSRDDFQKEWRNVSELSNILWFFNTARWYDQDSVTCLCRQIVEVCGSSEDDLTPRVVCRILRALTEITTRNEKQEESTGELRAILFDLFQRFGEALLSSRLSTLEVSSALASYARAAYILDMGIIDHLMEEMVGDMNQFSTRQIVEGVWACAKLFSYEKSMVDDSGVDPPYWRNVISLATEVVIRKDALTSKDTAQVLYSLGLLQLEDEEVSSPLAKRASEQWAQFTGQELANIIWGLSKVESKSYDSIFVLLRRIETDDTLLLTPQEASNILYALGRLDIRHEAIFTKLCNLLLDQIDSASAQAVANVLWASTKVFFRPPQSLLDTWATKKLGIVAIERQK
jgi:hypothetical protein